MEGRKGIIYKCPLPVQFRVEYREKRGKLLFGAGVSLIRSRVLSCPPRNWSMKAALVVLATIRVANRRAFIFIVEPDAPWR